MLQSLLFWTLIFGASWGFSYSVCVQAITGRSRGWPNHACIHRRCYLTQSPTMETLSTCPVDLAPEPLCLFWDLHWLTPQDRAVPLLTIKGNLDFFAIWLHLFKALHLNVAHTKTPEIFSCWNHLPMVWGGCNRSSKIWLWKKNDGEDKLFLWMSAISQFSCFFFLLGCTEEC